MLLGIRGAKKNSSFPKLHRWPLKHVGNSQKLQILYELGSLESVVRSIELTEPHPHMISLRILDIHALSITVPRRDRRVSRLTSIILGVSISF